MNESDNQYVPGASAVRKEQRKGRGTCLGGCGSAIMWASRGSVPGRRHSKSKGPVVRVCLVPSRDSREAGVVRAEGARGEEQRKSVTWGLAGHRLTHVQASEPLNTYSVHTKRATTSPPPLWVSDIQPRTAQSSRLKQGWWRRRRKGPEASE